VLRIIALWDGLSDSETHQGLVEHDPEKWEPVFGKDHAPTMS
jgi:hypothetical protein